MYLNKGGGTTNKKVKVLVSLKNTIEEFKRVALHKKLVKKNGLLNIKKRTRRSYRKRKYYIT